MKLCHLKKTIDWQRQFTDKYASSPPDAERIWCLNSDCKNSFFFARKERLRVRCQSGSYQRRHVCHYILICSSLSKELRGHSRIKSRETKPIVCACSIADCQFWWSFCTFWRLFSCISLLETFFREHQQHYKQFYFHTIVVVSANKHTSSLVI